MLKRNATSLCLVIWLLCITWPVAGQPPGKPPKPAVTFSASEVDVLEQRIKAAESPTLRAYLYFQAANWLAQKKEPTATPRLLSLIETALNDIQAHESELGPRDSQYHFGLLKIAQQIEAEEAAKWRDKYALQRKFDSPQEIATGKLIQAIQKLNDPAASTQAMETAKTVIRSGQVPIENFFGDLIRFDAENSPNLFPLLSAVIEWAEQAPGAIELGSLKFFTRMCMKEKVPREIKLRLFPIVLRETRATTSLLNSRQSVLDASFILQEALPVMQKLAPPLYAEGAAQLAAIRASQSLGSDPKAEAQQRIRESNDPLAQTLAEAQLTKDDKFKSSLLGSAARLAKGQGKLRQAIQIIIEARRVLSNPVDEFLDGIVQDALAKQDVETARYAMAEMTDLIKRSDSLLRLAQYFMTQKDIGNTTDALQEAAKHLANAPSGKEKALAYANLALSWADTDDFQFRETVRLLIKSANNIEKPEKDPKGAFNERLIPLLRAETKVFTKFAAKDRTGALNTADSFAYGEMKAAAMLGVYQYQPTVKPAGKE